VITVTHSKNTATITQNGKPIKKIAFEKAPTGANRADDRRYEVIAAAVAHLDDEVQHIGN